MEITENRNKLNIKNWNIEDRPREKMTLRGAAALSSAELLAILVGSGSSEETAVDLMKRILKDCDNSLRKVGMLCVEELCRYKGIGSAKAIAILAACELGKRRAAEGLEERIKMNDPDIIFQYFYPKMQDLYKEEFHVMYLNQSLKLICSECVSSGGISATHVDVRLVLRSALLKKATAIIVCHNHPSGNTTPSRQDDALTDKLRRAAEVMDIRLLDHLIIAGDKYYSYATSGNL